MELLEQLGKLNERHDRLELRVEDLENKIDDKADKNILDGLSKIRLIAFLDINL